MPAAPSYWRLALKAVIQRVSSASVEVDGSAVASIGVGFLVLVGVELSDTEADAAWLARKVASMRIFSDPAGKMNLSLSQVSGRCLVVSQFTLCADTKKGSRPGFDRAAPPAEGRRLYGAFASALASHGVPVSTGVFGAHMKVSLVNDGPVTIIVDSSEKGA